jgi:hypothetical protein
VPPPAFVAVLLELFTVDLVVVAPVAEVAEVGGTGAVAMVNETENSSFENDAFYSELMPADADW